MMTRFTREGCGVDRSGFLAYVLRSMVRRCGGVKRTGTLKAR